MLVFQSKSNVLLMMFNYGYVLVFVCIYTFLRVREHICEWVCVCVRQCLCCLCVCICMDLCVWVWVCVCVWLFNYPAHVTSPSLPPCFSFTEPVPERESVGKWENKWWGGREREAGRKRDGEIEAERGGGGWRFIQEKWSETEVRKERGRVRGWQKRGEDREAEAGRQGGKRKRRRRRQQIYEAIGM